MSDSDKKPSPQPSRQEMPRRRPFMEPDDPATGRLAEAMRRNLNRATEEALKRQQEADEARRRENER